MPGGGLDRGKEPFVDATKGRANADVDSLVPRFSREAKTHCADLFGGDDAPELKEEASPAAVDDELPAGIVRLPSAGSNDPPATGDPPRRLLEERRLDPDRGAARGCQRVSAWRVSPTDPDATPMQPKTGTALGYRDHDVVDGGNARIILAALVTPADAMENVPMRDVLWRSCFRRKQRPRQVTGDTTYGTAENIVAVEDAGIRAPVPLPDFDHRTPFFGKGAFAYNAHADASRCPGGERLRCRTHKHTDRVRVYQAPAATDLGALPGGNRSAAMGINGAGFVVGYSAVAPGDPSDTLGETRACRWVDGEIHDLNDLIPADSGRVLDAAYGINDDGLIVGAGVLNGEGRAFLLVPNEG